SLLEPQIYALLSQAKQLGVSLPELLQLLNERWQD
ncbi:MAG: GntR family transcriptional regulator, partial [Shewanella oncorhynchi]